MSRPSEIPTLWLRTSAAYRVAAVITAATGWIVLGLVAIAAVAAAPVLTSALGLNLALPSFSILVVGAIFALAAYCGLSAGLAASRISYQLIDDEIGYRSGFLSRTHVSLPYDRIQTVTLHNGLLERLLGISNVVCQSAADQSSIVLPGLRNDVAEATRLIVLDRARKASSQR